MFNGINMKNPKVTVLMSVYNGGKYLREAIESILNQTFKDFEFLIINDGSTDRTAEILQSYDDPRIKIINNEKNIGLTKSLNKGLKMARGEYIARMDADDISMPERLEKELTTITNDKEIGMVTSWIDEISQIVTHSDYSTRVRTTNFPEEIFYTLLFHNCIAHSTVLFNKELVLSLGGYDESYEQSQDYDLWIKLSRVSKIVKLREVLVRRRSHENTISRTNIQQKVNADKIFLKNICKLLSEDISPQILLQIRDNNAGIRNLIQSILIIDKINDRIVEIAPVGLDRKKLRSCGKRKKRLLIYNTLTNALTRGIIGRRKGTLTI